MLIYCFNHRSVESMDQHGRSILLRCISETLDIVLNVDTRLYIITNPKYLVFYRCLARPQNALSTLLETLHCNAFGISSVIGLIFWVDRPYRRRPLGSALVRGNSSKLIYLIEVKEEDGGERVMEIKRTDRERERGRG